MRDQWEKFDTENRRSTQATKTRKALLPPLQVGRLDGGESAGPPRWRSVGLRSLRLPFERPGDPISLGVASFAFVDITHGPFTRSPWHRRVYRRVRPGRNMNKAVGGAASRPRALGSERPTRVIEILIALPRRS